ncbi:MAG TPA: MoxR family ATPase [Gammaproteobacteria bacterium]|nr:MoxR family ATPase [Gammaproteobacteria bacterium]
MENRDTIAQIQSLRQQIQTVIVGQETLIDRLLVSLLSAGHLLVEGLPGLAKTTAVHTLADGLALAFQRIQFTPDMIPGDITGTDIFVPGEGRFRFVEGPLFHDIILADEINRAPPKVQSALLEAMQEGQVTVGGTTRPLTPVFMVMATQNPIEQEGTYPLPEAQLDRFMMKVNLDFPSAADELEVLRRETARLQGKAPVKPEAVLHADDLLAARRAVNKIYMDPMVERYIVTLVGATRDPKAWDEQAATWFDRGASPRATLALARGARAHALLAGRDFVEPGDVLELAPDVLQHRVGLSFSARAEGLGAVAAVQRLLDCVPVP